MSRYIDADALAYIVASNGDADFINKVTRLMIDAPTIDIPTWTPCSERLPEENGRYLCTYAEMQGCEYISCIDFGSFINGEWYVSGVIAWMPMPKIYKEDADD